MKPKVLITPLCGIERQGWVNPSLLETIVAATHDPRFTAELLCIQGAHGADRARNLAIDEARKRQADYLVMVDNDMMYPSMLDVLAEADASKIDVVAVAAGIMPTPGNYQLNVTLTEPRERLGRFLQVSNAGAGVLMIRRSVWEKLPKAALFQWAADCGEDVYFCRLAQAAGFKLWTHSTIAGHLHTTDITALVHQA